MGMRAWVNLVYMNSASSSLSSLPRPSQDLPINMGSPSPASLKFRLPSSFLDDFWDSTWGGVGGKFLPTAIINPGKGARMLHIVMESNPSTFNVHIFFKV